MRRGLGRFDVVNEAVVVSGLRLTIARPRSAEDLIDEDDYARDERLPYWAELWPSARVLADLLADADLRGRTLLELGCGVGLPAIVAARAGARVLAADWYPEALDFVAANAAAADVDVETMAADWASPPPELIGRAPFDLVVGADLLYEERNGDALAALLPRLLAPGGEAVIADPRRPHAERLIDPLVAAGWAHAAEERRHDGRPDESGPIIRVHRLKPPRRDLLP